MRAEEGQPEDQFRPWPRGSGPPLAYKDVDAVAGAAERGGLSRRVARMRPLGVLKG